MDLEFPYAYNLSKDGDQYKKDLFRSLYNYLMQEHICFSRVSVEEYVRIHIANRAQVFENEKKLINYQVHIEDPSKQINLYYMMQYPMNAVSDVDFDFPGPDHLNTDDYNLTYCQNMARWPA